MPGFFAGMSFFYKYLTPLALLTTVPRFKPQSILDEPVRSAN